MIYEGTCCFVRRFLRRGDRTVDQMIQAARSGKQNIIEGSEASGTSKETEIRLTGVARASLEELLEDYMDYLRKHDLPLWTTDSKADIAVGRLSRMTDDYDGYRSYMETRSDGTCANIMISLIRRCGYLLDRQIKKLEEHFIKSGGMREKMFQTRTAYRSGEQ